MDNIISKISEIESAASSIMDDANKRKHVFAKEMDAKTAAFDAELDKKTSEELNKLRSGVEREMKTQLHKEQLQAEHIIIQLQNLYDKNHTRYVKELFEAMIKE
ncbi:ATPase [Clostridium sp. AM58-1XD]|uniref:ATPase n=1 Tax=Clostridium sp. AM58-1XD TaxID=2292307 RepID=UPI000E553F13|nr:ATPase [Clostridium sp. AM58-1XD]RGY97375.1 ATPase [Clostridium sp. AM58-1XD]